MLVVKTAAVEVGVNFPIRPQDQAWIDTLFYIPREPRVRREYRMLTEEQRNTFHQAFVALKNDTVCTENVLLF
ncbi:hypothetical protein DPMN_169846 [Dreissena polymorpha]|uniref:Uncharacterized protein n=1 Tax=Dreissena polymorpha TaxID=45954 RepID=A0A9D4DX97_DREPO|nr:hypothetical protein DPMN_169846 [Dreissena polymorpha]